MRHGKETPTLAKDVLYVTLSVLYVPAQNFRMKNKATSAYYSRVFNRRCERIYKHWRLVSVEDNPSSEFQNAKTRLVRHPTAECQPPLLKLAI